jgi:kynurenine formamidase
VELSRRSLAGAIVAACAAWRSRAPQPSSELDLALPRRSRRQSSELALAGARSAPLESDADVERLLPRISNWGRWGADDQLGTLNFVQTAHRLTAVRGVRSGRLVSLARQTSLIKTPGVRDGRHEVQHADGASRDVVGFMPHGFALTHLDALCHAAADAHRLYNGVPASVVAPTGVERLDANAMGGGICGRGVLLDVGRAHGGALAPGTAIRVRDLEQAERAAGLTVGEGDILLVRNGAGMRNTRDARSGLHPECLPWLHARRVALLGSDGDNDVHPLAGFDRYASAMHSVAIPHLGLPLLDGLELDALGLACADERRWTFLLTVAPWRITGTTSSPVNPLAMF